MKRYLLIPFLFLFKFTSANDGAYYSKGGVFYPKNHTVISMDREILTFDCKNGISDVNVYFEFRNPTDSVITETVGFEAPLPGGDVSRDDFLNKRVKNFLVQVDGDLLEYTLWAKTYEGELIHPDSLHYSQWPSAALVFLFEIRFEPGITPVNHSYQFPASTNVNFGQIYQYILTTGSRWAGGVIEDFTLQIGMDKDQLLYVGEIFGTEAEWAIIGNGKITDKTFNYIQYDCRLVRLMSGRLQIQVKDLKPEHDFEFGLMDDRAFRYWMVKDGPEEADQFVGLALRYHTTDLYSEHYPEKIPVEWSARQLEYVRNGIYAMYGYEFRLPRFKEYFSQFSWYIPDPNLSADEIELSERDEAFLAEVIAAEQALNLAKD